MKLKTGLTSIIVLLTMLPLSYAQNTAQQKAKNLIQILNQKEKDLVEELKAYNTQLPDLKNQMNASIKKATNRNQAIKIGTTVVSVVISAAVVTKAMNASKPTTPALIQTQDPYAAVMAAPFNLLSGIGAAIDDISKQIFAGAISLLGGGTIGYIAGEAITSRGESFLTKIKKDSASILQKEINKSTQKQKSFKANEFLNQWIESSENTDLLLEISYENARDIFQEKIKLARTNVYKAKVSKTDRKAGLDRLAYSEVKGLKEITSFELANTRTLRAFVESILLVKTN